VTQALGDSAVALMLIDLYDDHMVKILSNGIHDGERGTDYSVENLLKISSETRKILNNVAKLVAYTLHKG
jgi:hypothetical protein